MALGTTVTAASAAAWTIDAVKAAVEHHDTVLTVGQKIWRHVFTRRIAVTGSPGAGKTVLVDYLSGRTGIGYNRPSTSQRDEQGGAKACGWRLKLTTIPGQNAGPQQVAIDKLFQGGVFRSVADGVVHVVANGFLSLRSDEVEASFIATGIKSIEELREARLQKELEDLDLFCQHIETSHRRNKKRPSWVVVAVSKADLFFDKIGDVHGHYSTGAFGQRLMALQNKLGSQNFRWLATPVSSRVEPFTFAGQNTPSSMTDEQKDIYARRLLQLIGDFCG